MNKHVSSLALVKNTVWAVALMIVASWPVISQAAESTVYLEQAHINVDDRAAVLRGGKYFEQQCLVCHGLKYLKYNEVVKSVGITAEKMPRKDQEWWFGTAPPDLSLSARVRTPDWLYTYLHSFYKDTKRAVGSNNLLAPDVNMPNPFTALQGDQELVMEREAILHSTSPVRYFTALELVKQGSMTPDDFDKMTRDMVTFLVYVSDPSVEERHSIGWWVIGFLVLFLFFLAIPLKKVFWRNIH